MGDTIDPRVEAAARAYCQATGQCKYVGRCNISRCTILPEPMSLALAAADKAAMLAYTSAGRSGNESRHWAIIAGTLQAHERRIAELEAALVEAVEYGAACGCLPNSVKARARAALKEHPTPRAGGGDAGA